MSGDITNITQAYTTTQDNTSKFLENTISQALAKAQNTTTPSTSVDPRNFKANYANSSYETNWISALAKSNLAMSQQPENDTHQTHKPYKMHTPHTLITTNNTPIRPLSTSINPSSNCLGIKLN